MTEEQKKELQEAFSFGVETELDMLMGAFECAELFGDWDSAKATFLTALDLVWRAHVQNNPGAPLLNPIIPRPDWAFDFFSTEVPEW
jgi:hypothetical protein